MSGCAPDTLRFAGKFAEDDASDGEDDWDASGIDFVKVLASLDGGADVVVLKWDSGSEDDISEPARLADDPNAFLTSTAQEVQRNISGT